MNSSERSHESVSDLNNSVDLNRRSGFRLITVEPVLFIASICNGMSIPLIQQYIYKRMQDEYDPDVVMSNTTCRHQHSNFTHVVEQHSSMWMMYLSVSLLVPTFFSSLVLGTCSDKLGRKVALLVPYIGSLARLLVVIVVIGFNLNVAFLFIGNIIDGMCGGAVLVIMSCYAYISDITTEQQRTFRIVILDCATMVGTIISSVGNGFLIQYTGFLWPHIAVVVLSAVNVFYIMSLQETIDKNTMAISSIGYFVEPLKVYVKYDNNGRRWKLAIIVVIMILSIMVDYGRSDSEALHLLSAPFCWSSILLGLYTATVQATRMVMSIMLTKVCMRWIGDLGLLFVACLSGAAYEFVFPLGKSNNGLFLVPVIGSAVSLAYVVTRSYPSKLVQPDELGKLFATLSWIQLMSIMLGSLTFNSIYIKTVAVNGAITFFVMAGTFALAALFDVILIIALRRSARYETLVSIEPINSE